MATEIRSDIDLCNAALAATGNRAIAAFDDGSTEAGIASANWYRIADALLAHPWTFTHTTRQLNRVDGTPDIWTYAYAVPADLTEVERVEQGGVPIRWERAGGLILTDADDGDLPLIVVGRFVPPVTDWPADVRDAMALKLEALFLRALSDDHQTAAQRDQQAEIALRFARGRDAGRRSPRKVRSSELLQARTGSAGCGRATRWRCP